MANDARFQREPALRSLGAAGASGRQTAIAKVNFDTARATEPGTYRRNTCLESTGRSLSRFCQITVQSEGPENVFATVLIFSPPVSFLLRF
jgi:hypothetical protein